jgi:peptidoglycan hydrolase-like protein with peptidoglycan-binding domain/GH24 family phage-related lysozyme (muramidase)
MLTLWLRCLEESAMPEIPLPGVALIKEFEGSRLKAYPDPLTGGAPYTIGWGSTRRKDGTPFKLGETITQAEADELLLWQLEQDFLPALQEIPGWSALNDLQQGALLSFAYNLGANFYGTEGFQTISRVLREADWPALEAALVLYRNPGSNVEEGLLRRRLTEAQTFLAGTPGVDLSKAGQQYLDTTVRTYRQDPQLSDQALAYLEAIAQNPRPTPDQGPRLLYLTDPPLMGEDVERVQAALVQAGAPIAVDGVFGPATQQAVEWFQRLQGLTVDGLVGPTTRALLFQRSLRLTEPYMTGEDVAAVQRALNQQGFDLEVDGVFGPATEAAVMAFQRQAGLLVDGIVGSRTRRILNAHRLSLTLPYIQGEEVQWLQNALARNGQSIVPDGVFGPQTEWAVKQFQAVNNLLADGVVGPATWVKLGL